MRSNEELIEWAKRLQEDYESIGDIESDVTFYSFADSAKDFIDSFLFANGVEDDEDEDEENC